MASFLAEQPCAKCDKGKGVTTCHGCQQSYCNKHFIEHRQELSQQMENIVQDHDLLRQDMSEETREHPMLTRINEWERESISKIQAAAKTARTNLQQLLDQAKNELHKSIKQITEVLHSCRESDDYIENDLTQWTENLKELRETLESPLKIDIEYDSHAESVITLLKIYDQQQQQHKPLTAAPQLEESTHSSEISSFSPGEKFNTYNGEVVLSEDGLIATCCSKSSMPDAIIYGFKLYSSGTHDVRFRIEKRGIARLFFGIFSSSKKRIESISTEKNNSAYGWWDIDSFVLDGIKQGSSNEFTINTGDELTLTLDCDHRQIHLLHLRKSRQIQLPIDLDKCSFPWTIVVKLTSNHDRIRILQ